MKLTLKFHREIEKSTGITNSSIKIFDTQFLDPFFSDNHYYDLHHGKYQLIHIRKA